jgi:signal peptidase I
LDKEILDEKITESIKNDTDFGAPEDKIIQNNNTKRPQTKTTKQLLIGLLIKIVVIVSAVWGLFTIVLGVHLHYGNNMYPALRDGDLIFSFRIQQPYINAAVLYKHNGKTNIGRVIAMEGSVVDISDKGELTVNGVSPAEEVFYPTYKAEGTSIEYPYTVPSGKVFILNDFREDKNDSRSFGAVNKEDLRGPLLFTMRRRGF